MCKHHNQAHEIPAVAIAQRRQEVNVFENSILDSHSQYCRFLVILRPRSLLISKDGGIKYLFSNITYYFVKNYGAGVSRDVV